MERVIFNFFVGMPKETKPITIKSPKISFLFISVILTGIKQESTITAAFS